VRFANSDSVPPSKAVRAAPLLSSAKARQYWFFCRLSVVESRRVLIAPFIPLRGPFGPSLLAQLIRPLLSSATGSENDLSLLSLEFETGSRSPEVSSTAFDAKPLDLHSVPLMDVGFATSGQLARTLPASYPVLVHRLASLLRASFGPRLAASVISPLRFAITSRPSRCEEDLHLLAVDHARHTTKKKGGLEGRPFSSSQTLS
jgi:hypothetical protein